MFLLAFPILVLATLALGLWTIERLRLTPEEPLEHTWIALVLGLIVLGIGISLLGFAQLLSPIALWTLSLSSIALGWRVVRWLCRRDIWSGTVAEWGRLSWTWWVLATIGIAYLLAQGFCALAPNVQWDTLAHHFLVPEMYLKWGGIYDLQQVQQSYFPSLFQMLYAGGMGMGAEQTASLLGWWWSTLVVLGVLVVGHQLWRLEAGIGAAIVMLTQELYGKQLQGGWADSGVALMVLLATYALLRHWTPPPVTKSMWQQVLDYEPGPICGFAQREMQRLREAAERGAEATPPAPLQVAPLLEGGAGAEGESGAEEKSAELSVGTLQPSFSEGGSRSPESSPSEEGRPLVPPYEVGGPGGLDAATPPPQTPPLPPPSASAASRRGAGGVASAAWLLTAALAMGGALAGSKHNALLPLALLCGCWALHWVLTRRQPFVYALRDLALFIGIALLPPACWYVRSWLLTGSPVYPLTLFGLFPGPELPVYAESSWIDRSYHRDLAALFSYPFMLTYSPSLIEGFQGRFPPEWPLLVPLLWWKQWKMTSTQVLTLLVIGTLALMFLVAPKETRYMLFAVPWIALLCGGGLAVLLEWLPPNAVCLVILPLLLWPLGARQRDLWPDLRERYRVVLKLESRGKYLGHATPNTATIAWMNAHLPDDAFVFCLEDRTYRLEPDWTNYYAATEPFPQTAEECYTFCYRQGVTHLFLGDGTIIQAQILKNIVDLPVDPDGITRFTLPQVMHNMLGELIDPQRHWVAWTTVRRFLQRAGFEVTRNEEGVEVFAIPHDTLLSTPVQRAHYGVMGGMTDMYQRRMMRLVYSDGLNMVFEYDYAPIGVYEDAAKFGVGRPAWTRRP